MAVQPQQLANGKTVYWVRIPHQGITHNKRIGFDKETAKRVNTQLLGNKEALSLDTPSALIRMRPWLTDRLNKRTGKAAAGEKQQVTAHVMVLDWFMAKRVCDVDQADIRKVVETIRKTGKLGESSITNIHSVLSSCFQWAVFDKILITNPCRGLPKGIIIRGQKKKRNPYTRLEARTVMQYEFNPRPVRVFLYLAFYTGMREGEICGRRFKDWMSEGTPLGAMHIHDQYDGQKLKTDKGADLHPRWVPIHEELEKVLRYWWEEGFELTYCRQPTVEDFIIPTAGGLRCHSRSSAYKVFRTALRRAKIENRSLHSTRHTFITVARAGGHDQRDVEKLTHNAKGTTLDQYTHAEWETLCSIVKGVDYSIDRSTTAGFLVSGPPKRRNEVRAEAQVHVFNETVGHSTVVEFDGRSMTVTAWEKETGIPRKTIADRLNNGWSVERSLTTPIDCRKQRSSYHVQSPVQSLAKTSTKWAPTQGLEPRVNDHDPA